MDDSLAAGYLARLGLDGVSVDAAGLAALQAAHLVAVPFENLDVWAGREVRCDETWTLSKVVERRRGGWCFELNGAFAALLEHLGFRVTRLAATVLLVDPSPFPDHLTIRVDLDRPWLVDVGFGVGTPRRPLPLDDLGPHHGGVSPYRLVGDEGHVVVERRRVRDGAWERCFRLEGSVDLPDLESSSRRLRESDNQFTAAPFATRALDAAAARVTWNDGRLVVRRPGSEVTALTPDPAATLRRWFWIDESLPVSSQDPACSSSATSSSGTSYHSE